MPKDLDDIAALGDAVHRLNLVAEDPLVTGLDTALFVLLEDNIFFVDDRHDCEMISPVTFPNLDNVLFTRKVSRKRWNVKERWQLVES